MKDYRIGYLLKRLKNRNLAETKGTIDYWQKTGRLTLRKRPTGHRVVNNKEIREIIEAFSPGGKGKYYANKN